MVRNSLIPCWNETNVNCVKVWDCLIISVNRAKLWQYVASLSPIYYMVTQWAEGPISFVPSEESIKCPMFKGLIVLKGPIRLGPTDNESILILK